MTSPANITTRDSAFSGDLLLVIERAARDENFDLEKLQRLLDMRELEQSRAAEKCFNFSLVAAQAEMRPILADADNPQTRSRYASFAALDREARPIYTRHGLAPSFNTEATGDPNTVRVIGLLAHRDGFTRRYQLDLPVDPKGARGGDVMTKTHATGSALTYAKRYLLAMMFNLAVDFDDDDGNAATPPLRRARVPPVKPRHMADMVDHGAADTIEYEPVDPFALDLAQGSTWADFLEPLTRHVQHARTIEEFDDWLQRNDDLLTKLRENKPSLSKLFEKNIAPKRDELLANKF